MIYRINDALIQTGFIMGGSRLKVVKIGNYALAFSFTKNTIVNLPPDLCK
jgi:hypothetical protein